MAASEAEICSAALNLLGDDSIASLTETSDRAKLCNRLYGIERDALLRSHPWNSAISRQALGELASAPIHGWAKAFQLPSDPHCLRALSINEDPGNRDPGDAFSVEGRELLTDAGTVNLRYIRRITDPTEFDGLLYEALIARLVWRLAYPVTRSRAVASDAFGQYGEILREARAFDGAEGTPDPLVSDDLISVR